MSGKRHWKLLEFVAHTGPVTSLALGRYTGRVLGTGGDDSNVNIWEISKPHCMITLTCEGGIIDSLRFDKSEETIVAGTNSGCLRIWDLSAAKQVRALVGHKSSIRALDIHAYGDFIASGSADSSVKLWDIRRKGCLNTYKGHSGTLSAVRFSPDGRWLCTAAEDGLVKLWDLSAGKQLFEFRESAGSTINAIEFHPSELLLATGSNDRIVRFYDLDKGRMVSESDPESTAVRCIQFHPSGSCLYAGVTDYAKVIGFDPYRSFSSVATGWSRVADMTFADGDSREPRLIGCSYLLSTVSTFVVDVAQYAPFASETGAKTSVSPAGNVARSNAESATPRRGDGSSPVSTPSAAASATSRTAYARDSNITFKQKEHKHAAPEQPSAGAENESVSRVDIKQPDEYRRLFVAAGREQRAVHPPSAIGLPRLEAPAETALVMPKPDSAPAKASDKHPESGMRVNMDDFHPVGAAERETPDEQLDDARVIAAIGGGHATFQSIVAARLKSLQAVRGAWQADGVRAGVELAIGAYATDQTVFVDVLGALVANGSVWNLELASLVLPTIARVVQSSKWEPHVGVALNCVKLILRHFASLISANVNRSAPGVNPLVSSVNRSPLAGGAIGVDVTRDERVRRCTTCYTHLQAVRRAFEQRYSGRSNAKLASVTNEIQLMIALLDQ